MKKMIKSAALLVAMALTFAPITLQAFNPATHLFIAENVFTDSGDRINLWYGSTAPDLAIYVTIPENWETSFNDTHYNYIDLMDYASSSTQEAFAKGWLTHNEEWGADYYAHINYSPDISFVNDDEECGYVTCKAALLSDIAEIPIDFAHFAIEVAVDLLLKNIDPEIGAKLLKANRSRSWQDLFMLTEVLVWQENRTDSVTLAEAEKTFRNLVRLYARALALFSPNDQVALAELGSQLAWEMYEIIVTPEGIREVLDLALDLCEDDYEYAIFFTIDEIKKKLEQTDHSESR